MKRRLLSILLVIAMVMSMVPMSVFAAEGDVATVDEQGYATVQAASAAETVSEHPDAPVAKEIQEYLAAYLTGEQAIEMEAIVEEALADANVDEAEMLTFGNELYKAIFRNEDLTEAQKVTIIGDVFDIIDSYGYFAEAPVAAYVNTAKAVVVALDKKVTDKKTLTLIEYVYARINDGELTEKEAREIIGFTWFDVLALKTEEGESASGSGRSTSFSGVLTASERIAVLNAVFEELKNGGIVDTSNPDVAVLDELYADLTATDAEGDQIVPDAVLSDMFDKIVAAVTEVDEHGDPVELTEEKITEVTSEITQNLLADERVKPENKVVVIEKTAEALGKTTVGSGALDNVTGSNGIAPELGEHLEAMTALRERLNAAGLVTPAQEGQIIASVAGVLPTVMAGQTPSQDEIVAIIDNTFNIIFNREDLTAEDKIEILLITLEVLEEYGYIDDAYELGYKTAKENGYVAEAANYVAIAKDAVAAAKTAVAAFAVEEKYEAVKAALIAELDATAETLEAIQALLADDAFATRDGAWSALLKLQGQLDNHINNLTALALEIGFVADPYVQKVIEAHNYYAALTKAIAEEAYNYVAGIDEAYAELVEEIGKVADELHPDLGAAVRKYLTEVPADALAILYAHGEDAVDLLIVKAALASDDIYAIYYALAPVVEEHGAEIYKIIAENEAIAGIKAEIEKATDDLLAMYEAAIKAPVASAMNADIEEAQTFVMGLYNALYPYVGEIVADVMEYPEYAELTNAAWIALMDLIDVADYAGEYGAWIAGDVQIMLSEQLLALFANNDEFMQVFMPLFIRNVTYVHNFLVELTKTVGNEIWNTYLTVREVIENLIDTVIAYGQAAQQQIKHQLQVLCGTVKGLLAEQLQALKDLVNDILNQADNYVKEQLQALLDMVDALIKQIEKQLDTLEGQAKKQIQAVYDALVALKEALEAAIADATDGAITNLVDAVKALKKAAEEAAAYLDAEAQAIINKIIEIIENLYWNATHEYYLVSEDSYYVAIGDGTALSDSYVDLLAAELGVAYKNLAKNGMLVADTYELLKAEKAEIAKADLITVGFGTNSFVNYAIDNIGAGIFTGEFGEHDWAEVVTEDGVPYVEEALAAIYKELAAMELGTLNFASKDLEMAQLMTVAIESYAYAVASYATELPEVVNAISEINPAAAIAIVGMYNPNDDVVINIGETEFDIGKYVAYLIEAANVHNFTYALVTDNAFFVEATEVETVNTKAALAIDEFLFMYLDLYGAQTGEAMNPSAAGHEYIKTQIREALVLVNEVEIEMTRMILGNELALQFAFKKAPIIEGVPYDVVITKTYADGREAKVVEIPVSQWKSATIDGEAYYYVSFNGIAAKEMSDGVNVNVVVNDKLTVSKTYSDSIREYAVRQLRRATEDVTKALYVDMLNYGAAAQTYFEYDAKNLSNADLTAAEQAYATKEVKLENNLKKGDNYVASQLNLASSIQLRAKFDNIDASMYAIVSFTNHVGRKIEVKVDGSKFLQGNVVVVDAVVAADYEQDVTITVYNAEGKAVASVVDSVASYIARMSGEDAPVIYDAVAKYTASAYAYLHQ